MYAMLKPNSREFVWVDRASDGLNDEERKKLEKIFLEAWDAPTVSAEEGHRRIRAALEERRASRR
jgi:hypothetical protein